MIKLNAPVLNEKGNVRPQARKAIVDYVASHRDAFAKANAVKGGYVLEVIDSNDNVVYVNFEVSVSANSLADRQPKARAPKAKVAESFEIED